MQVRPLGLINVRNRKYMGKVNICLTPQMHSNVYLMYLIYFIHGMLKFLNRLQYTVYGIRYKRDFVHFSFM